MSAALSADGKHFSIAIVNPTEATQDLDVTVQGARLNSTGRRWRLSGPNLASLAGLTHQEVQLTEATVNEGPKTFRVAPLCIEMYEFEKGP